MGGCTGQCGNSGHFGRIGSRSLPKSCDYGGIYFPYYELLVKQYNITNWNKETPLDVSLLNTIQEEELLLETFHKTRTPKQRDLANLNNGPGR